MEKIQSISSTSKSIELLIDLFARSNTAFPACRGTCQRSQPPRKINKVHDDHIEILEAAKFKTRNSRSRNSRYWGRAEIRSAPACEIPSWPPAHRQLLRGLRSRPNRRCAGMRVRTHVQSHSTRTLRHFRPVAAGGQRTDLHCQSAPAPPSTSTSRCQYEFQASRGNADPTESPAVHARARHSKL